MPIYMKIEGLSGDVTAAGHKGWIALESYQWGLAGDARIIGPSQSGGGHSEIVVTKWVDSVSPTLLKLAAGGGERKIEIHFVKPDADNGEPYLTIVLEDAFISNYSVSKDGERPMETISFNFAKIEFLARKGAPLTKTDHAELQMKKAQTITK